MENIFKKPFQFSSISLFSRQTITQVNRLQNCSTRFKTRRQWRASIIALDAPVASKQIAAISSSSAWSNDIRVHLSGRRKSIRRRILLTFPFRLFQWGLIINFLPVCATDSSACKFHVEFHSSRRIAIKFAK